MRRRTRNARRPPGAGMRSYAWSRPGWRTRTGPCRAASGRSWWCTCRRPPGNPRTSIHPSSTPSTPPAPSGLDLPELEHGPFIHPETARRLACDASVVAYVEDSDGATLSIGRRSRSVPPWMHRALRRRDGGCRFPGCTNTKHVDAHHVRHWADGGETALDNLILLCRHHHRLVHEHGFRCEPDGEGDFRFARPDGTALPQVIEPEGGVWTDVAELNERRGIAIDEGTCAGGWDGSPIDYGEAVARIQQATEPPRPAAGP
jgi:hypothetical protein